MTDSLKKDLAIIRERYALPSATMQKVAGLLEQNLPKGVVDREAVAAVVDILGCEWAWGRDYTKMVINPAALSEKSLDDLEKALSVLSAYCQAAPRNVIDGWITRLQLTTAQAPMGEGDKAMQNNLYITELQRFPADAARAAACKNWKWFPSLGEIEEIALSVCGGRISLKNQIEHKIIYGTQRGGMRHADFTALLEAHRPKRKKG